MAVINWGSIMSKAETTFKSGGMKATVDAAVSAAVMGGGGGTTHTPEDAANQFISVLYESIAGSGIAANALGGARGGIQNISAGAPVDLGGGNFGIGISFNDVARPSLQPETYGGIDNLAKLYNNGVDHTMRPVHGMWHGHETWSRTVIPGAHFMESAIATFMGAYGHEYGVTKCEATW